MVFGLPFGVGSEIMAYYRPRRAPNSGGVKMTVDGHEFPSETEAYSYMHLKSKQEAGDITDLVLQPKFNMFPRINLKTINPVPKWDAASATSYTPDFGFTIVATGRKCVGEAKGNLTPQNKLRYCIWLKLYAEEYDFLLLTAVFKTAKKVKYFSHINEHWYIYEPEIPKVRKKKS